ncbi:MAG: twin-arginine translocase subunit TatB [SAR116 cluster bacterium]|nr:twin-arginine translocase subunit TatB [SAR116 cluster bacterium]
MFDFGWQEFLVIAFVLVLVVGPKDLPKVLKTVTKYVRNMKQMASEFHRGIEKMADEADLKDVKQSFNEIKNKNFDKTIQSHLDPENEVTKALQQAKKSADLANEKKDVEDTLKYIAKENTEDSKNDNEKNKKKTQKDSEDNLSSAKV